MPIYSCHYPILHTINMNNNLDPEKYEVRVNGKLIYIGKVFNKGSDTSIDIDISEICREYLDTSYEKLSALFTGQTLSGIEGTRYTFTVSNGTPGTYDVMYNYNTDYKSLYTEAQLNLNQPILMEVDPRQRLGVTGLNTSGTVSFSYRINNATAVERSINTGSFGFFDISLDGLVDPGDTIHFTNGGKTHSYSVIKPCPNRFALYYVNKLGGMDYLVCSGKAVESWSPTRTDIRTYNNRLDRKSFELRRNHQQIEKRYELNTAFLSDAGASAIDNLIYSPKVWIHELAKNIITACYITDSDYTIKNFNNDRKVQYTIKLSESQQYIRR